ncbi:MAG: TetR/AcrR family transcriptional regulator [Rhodomicrobium sp.]|nr:TetR/AcrR family transcriptional regulator [Rhodomicrobium sp.]
MTLEQPQNETRARILAEAEQLFRHYGYGKTTMADIADACQMSPANLYRFFTSKSALMEAICTRMMAAAEERLFDIVRMDRPAEERVQRFVAEIHRHTMENLLDHKKVHELVVVAMQEQWHAIKAHLDRVCSYLELIIRDGVKSGEFPAQNTSRAAKCAHSAIVTLCHPSVVAQKLEDEERATPEEMAHFVANALKAQR